MPALLPRRGGLRGFDVMRDTSVRRKWGPCLRRPFLRVTVFQLAPRVLAQLPQWRVGSFAVYGPDCPWEGTTAASRTREAETQGLSARRRIQQAGP